MVHFDEHSCSSSCTFVLRAADCRTTSFRAWQSVHHVTAIVCALDETQVVVSRVVVTGVTVIVGRDVAVRKRGSGLERGGWRRCWCVVRWPGSECRRFRGAGSNFGAGDEAVVVVDDVVGVVDGGCAGVVSGGVAALEGQGGLETRAVGSFSVWVASSVVVVVVCIPKSMQSIVSAFFSKVTPLSSGGSVCRAAHRHSGEPFICEVVSAVVGAAWVAASAVSRIRGIDASREVQRPSPWFDTQFSFSSLWPCTFPDL